MMNPAKNNEHSTSMMTAGQTATFLKISERSLWSHTKPRGDIPCVRIGTAVRYEPKSLEQWISKQLDCASFEESQRDREV